METTIEKPGKKKKKKDNPFANSQEYIYTPNRTTRVGGTINPKQEKDYYQNGKGYIRPDNTIWIFCSEKPDKEFANSYPFFWYDEGEKIQYSKPSPEMQKLYKASSVNDASFLNIVDKTKEGENFYNEKELIDISSSSNFYIPVISKNDDPLKKLIKMLILEKGINIKRLKYKTSLPYQIPNMITALNNNTKMSITYFTEWMELINCEYDIVVRDTDPEVPNPLRHERVYDTSKDKFYVLINNKLVEKDMRQYYCNDPTTEEDSAA